MTGLSEAIPAKVRITLIDKNDAFMFGFSKLDVMFGRRQESEVWNPYRAGASRPRAGAGNDTAGTGLGSTAGPSIVTFDATVPAGTDSWTLSGTGKCSLTLTVTTPMP